MVVCRKPLILGIDLLGLAALAGIITLVIIAVLIPLQRDLITLPRLRDERMALHQQRIELATHNAALQKKLETHEQLLREQAGQPLFDVGTFLTHMSEQCRQSGIRLQTVEPLATLHGETYNSWRVQVRAQGLFPNFEALLRRIESWSPYVQVNNILIMGPADTNNHDCKLAWTVQVNYLPEWESDGRNRP